MFWSAEDGSAAVMISNRTCSAEPAHSKRGKPPLPITESRRSPAAEARIRSKARSKLDLPEPFGPISTFRHPGFHVTSLNDMKPETLRD